MTDHLGRAERSASTDALARDIAERVTGMPAYLMDGETWAAALAEADATYEPPATRSPLRDAIDRARYSDPMAFIEAYNETRRGTERNMNYSPQAWDREARRFQRIADERRIGEVERDQKRADRLEALSGYVTAFVVVLGLTLLILVLYAVGVRA